MKLVHCWGNSDTGGIVSGSPFDCSSQEWEWNWTQSKPDNPECAGRAFQVWGQWRQMRGAMQLLTQCRMKNLGRLLKLRSQDVRIEQETKCGDPHSCTGHISMKGYLFEGCRSVWRGEKVLAKAIVLKYTDISLAGKEFQEPKSQRPAAVYLTGPATVTKSYWASQAHTTRLSAQWDKGSLCF